MIAEDLRGRAIAALEAALPVFAEVAVEFELLSGRSYGAVEPYRLDDAEQAVVLLGSSAGTAKDAVDVRDRVRRAGRHAAG